MEAISSGIWQAKGARPGLHVMVLGGVHGDEKTGIDVVKRLHSLFAGGGEQLAAGTLTLILGNEEAIRLNKRGTTTEHNLNRMFTKKHLYGPALDFYESRRAHELAPLLASADVSIDIHSTSSPSRPFLPCAFSPRHERIYRWFSCDLVLTDPDYILGGEQATTDEYVDSCGGAGIAAGLVALGADVEVRGEVFWPRAAFAAFNARRKPGDMRRWTGVGVDTYKPLRPSDAFARLAPVRLALVSQKSR